MASAMDTANYFLATLGNDPESDITHLKLQKLVCYAQAMNLGLYGRPIFAEDIEAWQHGPVVPSLYKEFQRHGRSVIPGAPFSRSDVRALFEPEQWLSLEMVEGFHGNLSAADLRFGSHIDFPGRFGSKQIIRKTALEKKFRGHPFIQKLLNNPHNGLYDPEKDGQTCGMKELFDALQV